MKNGKVTINANMLLTADSVWSVMWSSPTVTEVTGSIGERGGSFSLTLDRPADGQGGQLLLKGMNTYSGGTYVRGTNVYVGVSSEHSLGKGAVYLEVGGIKACNDVVITNDVHCMAGTAGRNNLDLTDGSVEFTGDFFGDGSLQQSEYTVGRTIVLSGDHTEFAGTILNRSAALEFRSLKSASAKACYTAGNSEFRFNCPEGGDIHFGEFVGGDYMTIKIADGNTNAYNMVIGERGDDSVSIIKTPLSSNWLSIEKRGGGELTYRATFGLQRNGFSVYGGVFKLMILAGYWSNCSIGQIGDMKIDGGVAEVVGDGGDHSRKTILGASGGGWSASGTGDVTISGAFEYSGEGPRTFALGGTDALHVNTFSSPLSDAPGGGTVTLIKNGAGTWHLSKTQSYTGPTIVQSGRLVVDNTLSSSSGIEVRAGGMLDGTGSISVPTVVRADGKVSPSPADGMLHFSGSVKFEDGAVIAPVLDLANGTCGQISFDTGSDVVFDGSVSVNPVLPESTDSLDTGLAFRFIANPCGRLPGCSTVVATIGETDVCVRYRSDGVYLCTRKHVSGFVVTVR